jgi:hypothetical protein
MPGERRDTRYRFIAALWRARFRRFFAARFSIATVRRARGA